MKRGLEDLRTTLTQPQRLVGIHFFNPVSRMQLVEVVSHDGNDAGVLAALPADVLARLSDASAKSVDAVELKLVDGQTIVWGNAGEKELKAKVLAALLKAPANPKNPVQVYDVSVPRHPVTR